MLLDVREQDEWEAGHAPDALLVPMATVAKRLTELPTDRRIIVMCRSGVRSAKVTSALLGAGLDAVNLAGGILAWAAEHHAVVTDAGTPGVVV